MYVVERRLVSGLVDVNREERMHDQARFPAAAMAVQKGCVFFSQYAFHRFNLPDNVPTFPQNWRLR